MGIIKLKDGISKY